MGSENVHSPFNFQVMYQINNIHEQLVFDLMYKHVKEYKRMYMKPTQQLLNERRDKDSCIFIQPPLTTPEGKTRWTDFSLMIKDKDIDKRIEVRSLDVYSSDLSEAPAKFLRWTKTMPEKEMLLILLGDGFNSVTPMFREVIMMQKLPISIIRDLAQFENYLREHFK